MSDYWLAVIFFPVFVGALLDNILACNIHL